MPAGFDGSHLVSQLPFNPSPGGVDLGSAIVLPPGGNVIFLRSTAPDDFDPPGVNSRMVSTLSDALNNCRASRGDTIVVLPGHTENVTDGTTMLANLKAGVRIIGVGQGAMRPVFRWTTTTAQWALNKADVSITGLRLRLEGAVVVKGIVVTAADVSLTGCDIEVSSGASNLSTIAIELGTGSARAVIAKNIIRGVTGAPTDVIKVVGVVDQIRIQDNEMIAPCAAGTGLIHFTAAATNAKVSRNILSNTTASSTACILVDASTAASGIISDNYIGILADGTASATGIVFTASTSSTFKLFQNFVSDEPNKSGVLSPVVVST